LGYIVALTKFLTIYLPYFLLASREVLGLVVFGLMNVYLTLDIMLRKWGFSYHLDQNKYDIFVHTKYQFFL
jgi:hypothetical protein